MNLLFIGGHHDGLRAEVDEDRKTVYMPYPSEGLDCISEDIQCHSGHFIEKERYTRVTLRDAYSGRERYVMVHELEIFPIKRLIEGYRRSPEGEGT